MVPTKADDETFDRYVTNIITAWHAANADQLARGLVWYRVAHDLAEIVGDGDTRKGAGVIAALSPQKAWDVNVSLALDAGNGNVHGQTGDNLNKVAAILEGADPEDVLPMSSKTGHFFRNIEDPEDPDPVTIDRWAYRVATGDADPGTSLSNKTRYATLAHAYREAARRLGELPCVVQAVTWILARES